MTMLAIDPAAQTGIAIVQPDCKIVTYTTGLLHVAETLDQIVPPGKHTLYIERPPAGLHGASAVRFAGSLIADYVKSRWPRRFKIEFVNPTSWQANARKLISADKTMDSKALARELCNVRGIEYSSQDAADAAAILIAQLTPLGVPKR